MFDEVTNRTSSSPSPSASPNPYATPLWNSTLPIATRVDWLLNAMTIEEKLNFLATTTPDLPRLGITRCYIGSEAAHGVEARHDQGAHPTAPDITTSLPQPIGMSATWDVPLLEQAGEAVGIEARALWHRHPEGGLFRWAPTVDLERDPRWGRNEEGYGEDPVLTSTMAGAYVRGMQGGTPAETRDHLRISAALKHFFANNVENGRCVTNSTVDARNRHEYYYEPFRRCIEQSGVTSVMTSYNAVNGTVQMLDPRVEELLHGEFGLYGHVVSDGGAVSLVHNARHDTASHAETVAWSLKAGVDCMTDDMDMVHDAAVEAWERGLIDEADVDRALRRSFTTKIRLGLYDRPVHDHENSPTTNPFDAVSDADIDSAEHRELALRVAEESVVLLKNDGLLPFNLRETTCDGVVQDSTVAVIGPLADQWFQDWYGGEPPLRSTVLDGVRRVTAGATTVRTNSANIITDDALDVVLLLFDGRYAAIDNDGILYATDSRAQAERFRFQDWGDGSLTLRAQSTSQYLTADDDGTIRAGKRIPFGWFVKEVFHIADDGRLTTWSNVPLQITANSSIRAASETDLSDQRIGVPQTVTIGGQTSDGTDNSASVDQRATRDSMRAERVAVEPFAMEIVERGLERAAQLARTSDTVIAAVGCCPVINGKEDADRPSTAFPPAQRALMRTLVHANPRTAMVLISNYPYDIDWEQEHVPAIVWSASGGQSMSEAIARVLFGLVAPAGRLPQTWYGERVALPDMNDYDIIATKRTYQWHDGDVLYPFGHGLTYTQFAYDDLRVRVTDGAISSSTDWDDTEDGAASLHVSVRVTNVGDVASDEVVQIYVCHPDEERALNGALDSERDCIPLPRRRLIAFRRVRGLQPGESRVIEWTIAHEELRIFDVRKGDFRVPDGSYTVEAGASSVDIRVTATVRIHGEQPATRPCCHWIPIDYWDSAEHAELIAAEPLPGQRMGEACAMVSRDSTEAKRARGEDADATLSTVALDGSDAADAPAVASARFGGFAPFAVHTRIRVTGTCLAQVRVQSAGRVIALDESGCAVLPVGARELTLIVPVGSSVSGLMVE